PRSLLFGGRRRASRPHAPEHAVMLDPMMVERRRDMQDDERVDDVLQGEMRRLGEMRQALALGDQARHVEEPEEAERIAAGSDGEVTAHRHQHEHQIEEPVAEAGEPRLNRRHARRPGRRRIGGPPGEAQDNQREDRQADRLMDGEEQILGRSGAEIEHRPGEGNGRDDQEGDGPMEEPGERAVLRGAVGTHALSASRGSEYEPIGFPAYSKFVKNFGEAGPSPSPSRNPARCATVRGMTAPDAQIRAAEIVLPGAALEATLDFFAGLGFRVETIFPADAPSVAVIAGHGLRLRLERGGDEIGAAGTIRLLCRAPDAVAGGARVLTAPNGTRIEIVDADAPVAVPALHPRFVLARMGDDAAWSAGRAGMAYRDLIPDRLGGRFIASHIAIRDGGAVPDYVHFHKVRFQMIFCRKGWVRVVYEDQGEPFVLAPGDCVVQPPQIRHRVLENSPGLEVIEIGCPALHETFADHAMSLPNAVIDRARDFG